MTVVAILAEQFRHKSSKIVKKWIHEKVNELPEKPKKLIAKEIKFSSQSALRGVNARGFRSSYWNQKADKTEFCPLLFTASQSEVGSARKHFPSDNSHRNMKIKKLE